MNCITFRAGGKTVTACVINVNNITVNAEVVRFEYSPIRRCHRVIRTGQTRNLHMRKSGVKFWPKNVIPINGEVTVCNLNALR